MVNAVCNVADHVTPHTGVHDYSPQRGKRVLAMMFCVAAVSLADLAMTLTYATTTGMMEVNPIARYLMNADSPLLIVLWKLVTAGLSMSVLIALRHRRIAEYASWICLIGMLALAAHWVNFNHQVTLATPELSTLAGNNSPYWVHMGDDVRVAQY